MAPDESQENVDISEEVMEDEIQTVRIRGELVFSDSDYLEVRFSKAPAESDKESKERDEVGIGKIIRNDRRVHFCRTIFPPDYDIETHEVTGTYSYNIKIRKRSEGEIDSIYRSKNPMED